MTKEMTLSSFEYSLRRNGINVDDLPPRDRNLLINALGRYPGGKVVNGQLFLTLVKYWSTLEPQQTEEPSTGLDQMKEAILYLKAASSSIFYVFELLAKRLLNKPQFDAGNIVHTDDFVDILRQIGVRLSSSQLNHLWDILRLAGIMNDTSVNLRLLFAFVGQLQDTEVTIPKQQTTYTHVLHKLQNKRELFVHLASHSRIFHRQQFTKILSDFGIQLTDEDSIGLWNFLFNGASTVSLDEIEKSLWSRDESSTSLALQSVPRGDEKLRKKHVVIPSTSPIVTDDYQSPQVSSYPLPLAPQGLPWSKDESSSYSNLRERISQRLKNALQVNTQFISYLRTLDQSLFTRSTLLRILHFIGIKAQQSDCDSVWMELARVNRPSIRALFQWLGIAFPEQESQIDVTPIDELSSVRDEVTQKVDLDDILEYRHQVSQVIVENNVAEHEDEPSPLLPEVIMDPSPVSILQRNRVNLASIFRGLLGPTGNIEVNTVSCDLFVDCLLREPISLPLSRRAALELVHDMRRRPLDGNNLPSPRIHFRDVIAYLDSHSVSEDSSYKEDFLLSSIKRKLIGSSVIRGDKLKLLSLIPQLRRSFRSEVMKGRNAHDWETSLDNCSVSDLKNLLTKIDVILDKNELEYIQYRLNCIDNDHGETHVCEARVKLGSFFAFLGTILDYNK